MVITSSIRIANLFSFDIFRVLQRNTRGVVSGLDNPRKTSNTRGGASWIFTSSPNCEDSPTGTSIVLSGRHKKLRRRRRDTRRNARAAKKR